MDNVPEASTSKDRTEKTPAIVRKAREVLDSAWFGVAFWAVKIGVWICSNYSDLVLLVS